MPKELSIKDITLEPFPFPIVLSDEYTVRFPIKLALFATILPSLSTVKVFTVLSFPTKLKPELVPATSIALPAPLLFMYKPKPPKLFNISIPVPVLVLFTSIAVPVPELLCFVLLL